MPETLQRLPLLPQFEHQPRDHSVPCQGCRTRSTTNDHALCDHCLDSGTHKVRCHAFCRDVARAEAAR